MPSIELQRAHHPDTPVVTAVDAIGVAPVAVATGVSIPGGSLTRPESVGRSSVVEVVVFDASDLAASVAATAAPAAPAVVVTVVPGGAAGVAVEEGVAAALLAAAAFSLASFASLAFEALVAFSGGFSLVVCEIAPPETSAPHRIKTSWALKLRLA